MSHRDVGDAVYYPIQCYSMQDRFKETNQHQHVVFKNTLDYVTDLL